MVKVIASGVRKGNVIEHEDGKLYVVLKAESMHPGKGTPTTTIDMRRISDGVKTVVRYKTTDPLERAMGNTGAAPFFSVLITIWFIVGLVVLVPIIVRPLHDKDMTGWGARDVVQPPCPLSSDAE